MSVSCCPVPIINHFLFTGAEGRGSVHGGIPEPHPVEGQRQVPAAGHLACTDWVWSDEALKNCDLTVLESGRFGILVCSINQPQRALLLGRVFHMFRPRGVQRARPSSPSACPPTPHPRTRGTQQGSCRDSYNERLADLEREAWEKHRIIRELAAEEQDMVDRLAQLRSEEGQAAGEDPRSTAAPART